MTRSNIAVIAALFALVISIASTVDAADAGLPGVLRQLNEITQRLDRLRDGRAFGSWDQVLPGESRFRAVMNGAAVLDMETGLVWEQSPDSAQSDAGNWISATAQCLWRTTGGRQGWRLPTITELAALAGFAAPNLEPTFGNLQTGPYWSSTRTTNVGFLISPANPRDYDPEAWVLTIYGNAHRLGINGNTASVWCVRGGQGVDIQ